MRQDVYTSLSNPVGERFAPPPLPEHALDTSAQSLIASHLSADGGHLVTLWRATVEAPDKSHPAA